MSLSDAACIMAVVGAIVYCGYGDRRPLSRLYHHRAVRAICAGIIRPQARRAVCGNPYLRPAADACKGMGGGCGLFQFSSLLFASCFRYGLIASCLRPNGLRPKFASEECVRSLRLKCVRAVGILFYALSRSRGSRRRLWPAGGSIIVRIPVLISLFRIRLPSSISVSVVCLRRL